MAEALETILLQINLNADQIKKELVETKDRVADYKKQVKEAEAALKELEKGGEKNAVAISNQKEKIVSLNSELQANVKNQNTLQLSLTKTAQANILEAGSLAQKRAALAAGQIAYAQYSEEQLKTDEAAKALGISLGIQKEEIRVLAKEMGSTIENVGNYEDAFKSLSQEFKSAKNELFQMTEQFGESSKEAQAAAAKVEQVKEKVDDMNDRVAAMTVEGKLQTITKAAAGIAGGFAAAQGAAALFGSEGEELQKVLLKVQAAMAITTGLKEFAELPGTLKALSLSTGAVTVATQANTVAKVENTVVTETATVVQGEQVVVQQAALVSTEALSAAMNFMLGPIGFVIIGVTALVAAFALLKDNDIAAEIKSISLAAKGEAEAHDRTVSKLKELNAERLTQAENALKVAEAEGKGSEEIKKLQDEVLSAKKIALSQEREENKTHYFELLAIQADANKKLTQDLSDEELEKTKVTIAENNKQIEAIRSRNADIILEQSKLKAEQDSLDIQAENDRVARENNLANLRIGVIKSDRERELAAEKQALAEKLQVLLKAENENGEIIAAEREASLQRINQINFNYNKQAVDQENQLRILGTQEGTLARLDAERASAIALRNVSLQEEGLTSAQRKAIRLQTQADLAAIDQKELQLVQNRANSELQIEQSKQEALLAAKRSSAASPEAAFAVDLEIIQNGLQNQLKVIEQGNDQQIESIVLRYQEQADLAKGDSEQLQQIEQAKIDEINRINAEGDAQALAAVLANGQTVVNATLQFKDQQAQAALDLNQLKIEALDPTAEFSLMAERNAILEEQELAHATATIKNEEKLQETLDLIRKKYVKIEQVAAASKDQKSLKDASDYLGTLGGLFKKSGDEYKIFATSRAIIDTYSSATAATSLPPIGLGPVAGIPVAIRAVVSGLANIATINGVQFYDGGFTGNGDPRSESRALGWRPYTYHQREHISPAWMVEHPALAPVYDNLESIRKSKNVSTGLYGFAGGGYADLNVLSPAISAPVLDQYAIVNAVVDGISRLNLSVGVDEITRVAGNVYVNELNASS